MGDIIFAGSDLYATIRGLHHGKSGEDGTGNEIRREDGGMPSRTTEVAKSNDTMVCTDNTSGVLKPASTSESDSWRCQCLVLPVQPNEAIP